MVFRAQPGFPVPSLPRGLSKLTDEEGTMKQKILNALINAVLGAVASMITIYLGGQATEAIVAGGMASGTASYLLV